MQNIKLQQRRYNYRTDYPRGYSKEKSTKIQYDILGMKFEKDKTYYVEDYIIDIIKYNNTEDYVCIVFNDKFRFFKKSVLWLGNTITDTINERINSDIDFKIKINPIKNG
jgi:hypothetical protein